ncbi:U5-scytotoxiN-stH1A [Caudoviricetes sp.]|nr:U5-scytotoxiN-stH1A [Caudoviricetes sp.]
MNPLNWCCGSLALPWARVSNRRTATRGRLLSACCARPATRPVIRGAPRG